MFAIENKLFENQFCLLVLCIAQCFTCVKKGRLRGIVKGQKASRFQILWAVHRKICCWRQWPYLYLINIGQNSSNSFTWIWIITINTFVFEIHRFGILWRYIFHEISQVYEMFPIGFFYHQCDHFFWCSGFGLRCTDLLKILYLNSLDS